MKTENNLQSSYQIIVGGWYPRTQLHMVEVYKFLSEGDSELELSKQKLKEFHKALNIRKVTKEPGEIEYVKAETNNNLIIKYFEDGLYILKTTSNDIDGAQKKLGEYIHNVFEPAISYIFSLGAPIPKILAGLKTPHPPITTVIGVTSKNLKDFIVDKEKFGEVYDQSFSNEMAVFRMNKCILIVASSAKKDLIEDVTHQQIFFREFDAQLKSYLNIHRLIWEKIAAIKKKKEISAKEAGVFRDELDGYQETINLINNRLNQMKVYVGTRAKAAKANQVDKYLTNLFQYEFETLLDTHEYIRELWQMTKDYVASAIQLIVEVKNQSTERSIQTLKLITIAYALVVIWFYLNEAPRFSVTSMIAYGLLIALAWLVNSLVNFISRRQKYQLKFRRGTPTKEEEH
ncbi:MAG: hypothetical protein COT32_01335 [Candidatus Nealsonbacteria bacterium CG08_land_8_20_14_0_20_36_22]|uniref:Uncharacterized protein n=1 Tax=Candidatus Nealsonbacteria bacterium CG08_land_8_20_14_0_20_36_22 TaxID=1974704 RepID=A0A2H0YNZ4_9BACT|nr:MAG: hypothetical protein COT32_01335 [Candidatus Nealsonbacteria bacterium CG08_land_8_20_14_0_20_36_22]